MVVNGMFYNTEDAIKSTFHLGYYNAHLGTIYIALISSLITIPTSTAMVAIFKKVKRVSAISPATNHHIFYIGTAAAQNGPARRQVLVRIYAIAAWLLVFMTSAVSTFFIILYSLHWGQDVSKQWLLAEMTSFLLSVCAIDPFKKAHGLVLALLQYVQSQRAENVMVVVMITIKIFIQL
ncbi:uncharacterized protein [Ptychodera flava]|uniref:uncharacterized protein n=1 Tax=Ptychodera flava TaxID=63121 RepID=UPI00396A5A70